MKKYNIFVGVLLLLSLCYLFHLNAFSRMLLKERANGKTNIEIFLSNSSDLIIYFLLAFLVVIASALIGWRMMKELKYSNEIKEFVNAIVLVLILVIIIVVIIKMITIPIMQILLSALALVLGGMSLTNGSK